MNNRAARRILGLSYRVSNRMRLDENGRCTSWSRWYASGGKRTKRVPRRRRAKLAHTFITQRAWY